MGHNSGEFGVFEQGAEVVIVVLAMTAGALTSAAWVAKEPWCYLYALVASGFFVAVRRMQ